MQSWSGRIALVIALLTATIHGQAPADLAGLTFNAHVIGIVDGDTPERGEPFTQQARNLTRVLAFDQDVIVIGKELDRYGRLVARVRLGQVDLSVEIVAAGLARDASRSSAIDPPPLALDLARELLFGRQDLHVLGSEDLADLAQH